MSEVVTGEAVPLDVRVARLGSRSLSRALDIAVQAVVLFGVELAVTRAAGLLDADILRAITIVVLALVVVGYPVAWETIGRGRTLGKLALGLRAVGTDGGPIRFRQALVRAMTAVVEIWVLVCVPAVISSLVTVRAQRLGDLFAGTIVVSERVPRRREAMAQIPASLRGWTTGLDVSSLPDDVAMLARNYLSRLDEFDPLARDAMGDRLAAAVAAHVTPPAPPGTSPVDYLNAVLAERTARARQRFAGGDPRVKPSTASPDFPGAEPADDAR